MERTKVRELFYVSEEAYTHTHYVYIRCVPVVGRSRRAMSFQQIVTSSNRAHDPCVRIHNAWCGVTGDLCARQMPY